jgi:hypothetical protein
MAGEQPKKPVGGAYGTFLAEKRPEFTKACEGQKASAISTMAGEAWKKLSEAEKRPYQEKYEVAKAKFDTDMAAFLAAGGEKTKGAAALRTEKRREKAGKKAKDPNMPKKPVGGAYGVFLAENRAAIEKSLPTDHKITDVAKAAGVQFKALSDAAKTPYQDKFLQKQEEYKKAVDEYKAAHPDAAADEDEEDAEENEEGSPEKAAPKKASPKKRAAADSNPSPRAKRGRASKASTSAAPEIDAALWKEAQSKGLDAQLRNLVSRPDVQASGKTQKQMLEALNSHNGLVNKAKAVLLGGA